MLHTTYLESSADEKKAQISDFFLPILPSYSMTTLLLYNPILYRFTDTNTTCETLLTQYQ